MVCNGKTKLLKALMLKMSINQIRLPLIIITFFAEFPLFPDHFSLRSQSSASLNCIAIDQPRDTEWRVKYLCYKPALKKLTITWSSNGTIVGQHCINTRMPYERAAAVWKNGFLCVPRDSLLNLSWSVSGRIQGKECLEVRRTRKNTRGYFLCGTSKFKKIGELSSFPSQKQGKNLRNLSWRKKHT